MLPEGIEVTSPTERRAEDVAKVESGVKLTGAAGDLARDLSTIVARVSAIETHLGLGVANELKVQTLADGIARTPAAATRPDDVVTTAQGLPAATTAQGDIVTPTGSAGRFIAVTPTPADELPAVLPADVPARAAIDPDPQATEYVTLARAAGQPIDLGNARVAAAAARLDAITPAAANFPVPPPPSGPAPEPTTVALNPSHVQGRTGDASQPASEDTQGWLNNPAVPQFIKDAIRSQQTAEPGTQPPPAIAGL